jgi:ubiquinone/menaquinone biosynthesis C-methylase UbiE
MLQNSRSSSPGNNVPPGIQVFDDFHLEYDRWFSKYKWVYRSEVEAVKKVVPREGYGLEVGVGTGRFSTPFGLEVGVEPSTKMGSIAKKKKITVVRSIGENLPFRKEMFDFVLNVTTICFVDDPFMTLSETRRVLKMGGLAVIGFIDKESNLGRLYEAKKEESRFYKHARFYSVKDIQRWLSLLSFTDFSVHQTIFQDLHKIHTLEPIKEGYGEGGFLVFKAKKDEK